MKAILTTSDQTKFELKDTEVIISNRIDNVANANDFLHTLKDEYFSNVANMKFDDEPSTPNCS
jgi:hypothetical protein